jgi:hypothetical protein
MLSLQRAGVTDYRAAEIRAFAGNGMIRRQGEIAVMVGGRVDLAREPLRLRASLFDLRNLA